MLNMLAGLEKPTKGTITIHGTRVDLLSERQLAVFRQVHLGFVFQSYNLLPTLTAVENVALPLAFKGVGKSKREKTAKDILKAVGLGDRFEHRPTQMSGGQQQRVGIARAFVAKPDVVFADEPTGNLDSKTTIEVMEQMVAITRARDRTLLIVTHDIEIAQYADRIIHIKDGNIEEDIHQADDAGYPDERADGGFAADDAGFPDERTDGSFAADDAGFPDERTYGGFAADDAGFPDELEAEDFPADEVTEDDDETRYIR